MIRYAVAKDALPPHRLVGECKVIGYLAIAVTIAIWSGFALSVRAIGASRLTPADVALIRFGIPVILLLPFLPSKFAGLKVIRPRYATMVATGAGLPFFLLASSGARFTSAAHVGAMIAGTSPLSVALLGSLLFRERVMPSLWLGLSFISAGVFALVLAQGVMSARDLAGLALLLSASMFWSLYTIGLRRVALDPISSTILVVYPSFALLLAATGSGWLESNIRHVSFPDFLPFLIIQGFGVGLGSTFVYALAIKHLGSMRCASLGALAPVLTTIVAAPLLGETITWRTMTGVLLITAGVLLANRQNCGSPC